MDFFFPVEGLAKDNDQVSPTATVLKSPDTGKEEKWMCITGSEEIPKSALAPFLSGLKQVKPHSSPIGCVCCE